SKMNHSRIILALDLSMMPRDSGFNLLKNTAMKILSSVANYICAVKINMQLLLPLGLYDGVSDIIRLAHDFNIPTIMDCKLSDVGHTNLWASKHYFEAGFDAIIVNPMVGWSEGVEPVFNVARDYGGRGVILLTYMSHKASPESYELPILIEGSPKPLYKIFAERALKWGADGVIVGGTYPEKIREIKSILLGKIPIYTPGIGLQGGEIKACIDAGSEYFIVGRSIFQAEDPVEAARRFRDLSWF
ncbi:MAG: orotidine-5'-phosphate decarboxylase, partial [Candidatus Methanomethylicia archaeon]